MDLWFTDKVHSIVLQQIAGNQLHAPLIPLSPPQIPSYLCGSSPALATLARHVVEDFMFDQNMAAGSVSCSSTPPPSSSTPTVSLPPPPILHQFPLLPFLPPFLLHPLSYPSPFFSPSLPRCRWLAKMRAAPSRKMNP